MEPVPKEIAELAILDRFITAYHKRFGIKLINVLHRDKPDFEVTNPKTVKRLGIEVTGTYQNEEEAKIQYGSVQNWDIFVGSGEELITSLNSRLKDKAQKSKSYKFDGQIFLAIWLGSLVFNQKMDVDFIRHRINIPENDFSEIWLIIQSEEGTPELYPLQVG